MGNIRIKSDIQARNYLLFTLIVADYCYSYLHRREFSVFQCHLNTSDKQDAWVHCLSLVHKNRKLLKYSSGVFQNVIENLCSKVFVQIIQLRKALLSIELGKKPQTLFISILYLAPSISINHTVYTSLRL